MLNIYIGYDKEEPVAYHVLAHSILQHTNNPVSIIPLKRELLQGIYQRPRATTESTDFSLTRFLVPYLSGYDGYSLFMDCDMLIQSDIYEILAYSMAFPEKAVSVCRHNYIPSTKTKFLNQPQENYARKNWSSFMLFSNNLCRQLTPYYVGYTEGLTLHGFRWLDDAQIGSIPLEWNWLVGEYPYKAEVKNIHYTLGGPWFEESKDCEYADLWRAAKNAMLYPQTHK